VTTVFSEAFHVEVLALGSAVTAAVILTVIWIVRGFHKKVEDLVNKHKADFMLQYTAALDNTARDEEASSRSIRVLAASIIKVEERLDKIETLLEKLNDDRGTR